MSSVAGNRYISIYPSGWKMLCKKGIGIQNNFENRHTGFIV